MKKQTIYRGGRMSGKSVLKIDEPEITPLEALERIKSHNYHNHSKKECLSIIETALKALEIINDCCIVAKYPDNTYELAFCKKILIDKEEYDLLKEVLL